MPQKESRMQILWFWQEKNKTVIRKFWAEISHHYYPVQQFSLISPDNISGESQVSRDRRSHQAANIFPMDSSRSWQSSSCPGSTPLRSRSCIGFYPHHQGCFPQRVGHLHSGQEGRWQRVCPFCLFPSCSV